MKIGKMLSFAALTIPFAATVPLAQGCDGFAVMTSGAKYQLTTYDKGDRSKVFSTSDYEVTSSRSDGATVHVRTVEKGKTTLDTQTEVNCTGNGIAQDTKTLLSKEMSANIKNPDVKADVDGNNLEIPNQLSVGQSLPESRINIVVSAGKMSLKSDVHIYNREVVGQESVTVPAGTFECYVVTDKADTKMMISKSVTHKIWLARGVGVVKEETYDSKGRLDKLKELTSFQK